MQGGRGGDRGWKQFGWIVQKYIERPLLVHGRKFDLRCYVLLVLERPRPPKDKQKPEKQRAPERLPHHSDRLTAFLYDEGYVRTSSAPYSLDQSGLSNIAAHLTNDAVQKQFEGEYGKHESANKLDFKQFQAYISKHHDVRQDFVQKSLLPTLRDYVRVSVTAASQVSGQPMLAALFLSAVSSPDFHTSPISSVNNTFLRRHSRRARAACNAPVCRRPDSRSMRPTAAAAAAAESSR